MKEAEVLNEVQEAETHERLNEVELFNIDYIDLSIICNFCQVNEATRKTTRTGEGVCEVCWNEPELQEFF